MGTSSSKIKESTFNKSVGNPEFWQKINEFCEAVHQGIVKGMHRFDQFDSQWTEPLTSLESNHSAQTYAISRLKTLHQYNIQFVNTSNGFSLVYVGNN